MQGFRKLLSSRFLAKTFSAIWGEAGGTSRGASDLGCTPRMRGFALGPYNSFKAMQETVTLECTEARKEGKPPSRYLTKRNKKTVTERIEKKKYNPFLKRHTLHKEIK